MTGSYERFNQMRKGYLKLIALALVSLAVAPITRASDIAHLVPVEPDFGVSPPLGKLFKRTYEKSLFTKKNWVIRYYRADTPVNVTIAFSIYRKDQAFWVNVCHATPEMDPLIREAAETDRFDVSSVLGQIDLKSFDFPIPKSTATGLSTVWRNLLSEVKPDPSLRDRVFTDGPVVILFAKDGSNQILSGRVPPSAEQDVKFRQVEEVFTDLRRACTASKTERAKIYGDIEVRLQAISDTLREEQNGEDHSRSIHTAKAQRGHIRELNDADWLKQKVSHQPETTDTAADDAGPSTVSKSEAVRIAREELQKRDLPLPDDHVVRVEQSVAFREFGSDQHIFLVAFRRRSPGISALLYDVHIDRQSGIVQDVIDLRGAVAAGSKKAPR